MDKLQKGIMYVFFGFILVEKWIRLWKNSIRRLVRQGYRVNLFEVNGPETRWQKKAKLLKDTFFPEFFQTGLLRTA